MFGLKTSELLIILAVILILFGGTRLPQLGKALGSGIRNFKRGSGSEEDDEAEKAGATSAAASTPAESKSKA